MDPILGAGLLKVGAELINRIFPDKATQDEAKLKLLEMQQAGELAVMQAELEIAKSQMDVNKEEARSESLFKSGWRPFVGWVCGTAFAYNFLLGPIFTMVAASQGVLINFSPLDLSQLLPVLLGMLGLGGYRTFEKYHRKQ